MKLFIENGIPAPAAYDRVRKWPIAKLDVGQSFLVRTPQGQPRRDRQQRLGTLVVQHANSEIGKGKKFITRAVDNGIRVWRIA